MLYDSKSVHEMLPQKSPFAFVDEILELNMGDKDAADETARFPSLVAVWHLTGEEAFFKGHFPGNPVLPGVLQIESMAQAATLLTKIAMKDEVAGKRPAFMGVEQCRFKSPAVPPVDLTIKVSMLMARRGIFKYAGEIRQGDTLVCKGEFSAAMV